MAAAPVLTVPSPIAPDTPVALSAQQHQLNPTAENESKDLSDSQYLRNINTIQAHSDARARVCVCVCKVSYVQSQQHIEDIVLPLIPSLQLSI